MVASGMHNTVRPAAAAQTLNGLVILPLHEPATQRCDDPDSLNSPSGAILQQHPSMPHSHRTAS